MALRPYDINNLVAGAVRVLYAPTSEPVPVDIADIIAMTDPYAPVGSWVDFGASTETQTYSRSIESEGLEIQQESGAIIEDITDVGRTFAFDVAEIEENNLKVLEEAPSIETIAAVAGASAQKGVAVGGFTELTQYRVAFIGIRKKQSGTVTEPGGATRGRMVAVALYRCQLSAEESSIEFGKGNLASAGVNFTSFPESGQPEDQDVGKWLFEDSGTIT